MALRIVSLNTWQGTEPYQRRLDLMLEGLLAQSADVVFLQEVFSCITTLRGERGTFEAANIAQQLEAFGYQSAHYPVRRKVRVYGENKVDSYSGLAILVCGEIEQVSELELPSAPEDGERNALYVRAQVQGTPLALMNTHLTHLRQEPALRLSQMQALLEAWPDFEKDDLKVLGGDLNAGTDSDIVQLAIEKGFTHFSIRPEGGACTLNIGDVPSEANHQIDHLMVKGGGDQWAWRPLAETDLDEPDGEGVFPSDHKLIGIQATEKV